VAIYKHDIEESKRRVEAWWHHEILDRAAVQVRVPRRQPSIAPVPAADPEDVEAWFTDPELVLPRLKRQLANTYFGGEAFPVMFPVSINMVAITAAYLGSPLQFVNTSTTWSHPIVDDWARRPAFRFRPANRWWRVSERLLSAAVEQADGYYVGVPDLNGPSEILALLRGTERLALDLYDHPREIKPALTEIKRAWYDAWCAADAIVRQAGGHFFWMGIWSERPATDLQSDFSCMMSPEMFDAHFLPFLAEQTEMVERTIYHLDGPGAIKHLDSLLALPDLDGIQWVPGAGSAPAIEWIELLKRIQDAGKLVYAYCDKDHVQRLLTELRPEGLILIVDGCESESGAGALLENVERWTHEKVRPGHRGQKGPVRGV
jgi:hypothetical protein